jgi:hypothetical protein
MELRERRRDMLLDPGRFHLFVNVRHVLERPGGKKPDGRIIAAPDALQYDVDSPCLRFHHPEPLFVKGQVVIHIPLGIPAQVGLVHLHPLVQDNQELLRQFTGATFWQPGIEVAKPAAVISLLCSLEEADNCALWGIAAERIGGRSLLSCGLEVLLHCCR